MVADVGGNYESEEGGNLNVHAFLAGARYSFRGKRIRPYVEGLAGVARAAVSAGGVSESTSDFAVQAGAGIAVKVDERFSLRTGVDFRMLPPMGTRTETLETPTGLVEGASG